MISKHFLFFLSLRHVGASKSPLYCPYGGSRGIPTVIHDLDFCWGEVLQLMSSTFFLNLRGQFFYLIFQLVRSKQFWFFYFQNMLKRQRVRFIALTEGPGAYPLSSRILIFVGGKCYCLWVLFFNLWVHFLFLNLWTCEF